MYFSSLIQLMIILLQPGSADDITVAALAQLMKILA
jgi:hypothetical protein